MSALSPMPCPEKREKGENTPGSGPAAEFSPFSPLSSGSSGANAGFGAGADALAALRSYKRPIPPKPARAPRSKKKGSSSGPFAPLATVPGVPLDWCEGVTRLAMVPPLTSIAPQRWRLFQTDAVRILHQHGSELHRAGWDALDLFGLHARAPDRRMDAAGLAWLLRGRSVGAVTAETVAIVTATGQELRCWRMGAQARQETVPAWALHNMAEATIQHHLSTSTSEDRT